MPRKSRNAKILLNLNANEYEALSNYAARIAREAERLLQKKLSRGDREQLKSRVDLAAALPIKEPLDPLAEDLSAILTVRQARFLCRICEETAERLATKVIPGYKKKLDNGEDVQLYLDRAKQGSVMYSDLAHRLEELTE